MKRLPDKEIMVNTSAGDEAAFESRRFSVKCDFEEISNLYYCISLICFQLNRVENGKYNRSPMNDLKSLKTC
jgi:hypothetical protein